jgi:hypothetical protein
VAKAELDAELIELDVLDDLLDTLDCPLGAANAVDAAAQAMSAVVGSYSAEALGDDDRAAVALIADAAARHIGAQR